MAEATPQEQQAYESAMEAIGEEMYSDAGLERVFSIIGNNQTPEEGVAEAAAALVGGLDVKMKGALPETVIMPLGAETAELVAELANRKGLAPNPDDQFMDAVGRYLVADLSEIYNSQPDEISEFMSSMGMEGGMGPGGPPQPGAPAQGGMPPGGPPGQTPPAGGGMVDYAAGGMRRV